MKKKEKEHDKIAHKRAISAQRRLRAETAETKLKCLP